MRAKARFTGANPLGRVAELTDFDLGRLRALWPYGGEASEAWGHPSEVFVQSLADVVLGIRALRQQDRLAVTREDARIELAKVAQQLREAEQMLRTMSPAVDVLLGVEADPLGCAETVGVLLGRIERAEAEHALMFSGLSVAEADRRLAHEVCVQVAGVLLDHGIEVAATAQVDTGGVSIAVTACAVVGELSGIVRSPATWRDLIAEARVGDQDSRNVK